MFEILGKSSESIGNESLVWQLQLQFQLNLYYYCKFVKVRTLCILCNNWCLFRIWYLTPVWLGVALYTVWVEFPRPDRQTVYIQNRDRSSLGLNEFTFLANTFLNNLFHINIYGYSDITVITNKNIELFAS